MSRFQKPRITTILKWVCSNFAESYIKSSKILFFPTGSFYIAPNPRHYRTKRTVQNENADRTSLPVGEKSVAKVSRVTRREAQAALLEYLHYTRNLQFMDAENMSKNSPHFLKKLLKRIEKEANIEPTIARFLRYHPINEFEPFFESLGLEPCEYNTLLPRNLMFLSDDVLMLENYQVLCNYGIARNKIGKVYKEASEVFRYGFGVLPSKLQAYEDFGLSQSSICKVIACCPSLLIGDVNKEFVKVLETLKTMGIEFDWIGEHLFEHNSYNWSMMLSFLSLFREIGCSDKQLGRLIMQHPGLLLEGSGDRALVLIGILLKFGSMVNEICLMFLQLPEIQVGIFFLNMKKCFRFLFEIEMKMEEIGKIFCAHPLLLGSCNLKKPNTVLCMLNVGKKRLCKYIQENPLEMKKLVLGSRIGRLPNSGERERSKTMKTKFLVDMGFVKDSNEMEEALKVFRGRGGELQDRFDCIVKAGLDRKDVYEMVRVSPQILNQRKDVLKMKIDFLVNFLGYPISSLVPFPSYLSYTMQRIKLRVSMYNWLKDQGVAEPMLALSTVIACSHKTFMRRYVYHHPKGPQVWQDLRKTSCSK